MVGGVQGASKRRPPDAVRTQAVIVSSRERIGRRRRANRERERERESHATSKRTRIGAKRSRLDPPASIVAADAVRDSVWLVEQPIVTDDRSSLR
ncbi:hypothetical protein EUGRSUZ_L01834 [Eucalyptus grandis]|uniref:Uncharacterized protein n=1 Tax=Eucalyptus grandis TaxID=71139 RepID=A0A058ZUB8_EUCGR|nr:hypothetical protein EUGRSUZ_L01834 [Eucalyptus grandis]